MRRRRERTLGACMAWCFSFRGVVAALTLLVVGGAAYGGGLLMWLVLGDSLADHPLLGTALYGVGWLSWNALGFGEVALVVVLVGWFVRSLWRLTQWRR